MTEAQIPAQPMHLEQKSLDEIAAAKIAFYEDNPWFAAQLPGWMQSWAGDLALGQELTEITFAHYEEQHNFDLTTGQHPHFAVMSSSHWLGHPNNIIGMSDYSVGEALMFRVPTGSLTDESGKMTFEASLYLPLATKLKGIDTVFHSRTDAEVELNFAYRYYSNGESSDALPEMLRNDKYLKEFIDEHRSIFKEIEDKGVAYYENKYLLKNVDDETRKKLTVDLSDEERFVRALSIQMLLSERKLLTTDEFAAKNTVTVFQAVNEKREYVWNPDDQTFVIIPEAEKSDSAFVQQKETFFSALPESFTHSDHGHPAIANYLMRGAHEYKNVLKNTDPTRVALDFFMKTCSDGRTAAISVAGPLANRVRNPQRVPGAFSSLNGKLTKQAGLSAGLANYYGVPYIIAGHTNCGAKEAEEAYHSKTGEVPGAFNKLAQINLPMYEKVQTLKLDYYRKTYGVPVASVADCLSVQQTVDDYAALKREYPDMKVMALIQDLRHKQNYLYNPDTGKFVAVPAANLYGPKAHGPVSGSGISSKHDYN